MCRNILAFAPWASYHQPCHQTGTGRDVDIDHVDIDVDINHVDVDIDVGVDIDHVGLALEVQLIFYVH